MSFVTIKGIYTEYQDLTTVAPDDLLGHAANLLRQYQFHHLPVVRGAATWHWQSAKRPPQVFEGMLTSQDIDLAVALERDSQVSSTREPWQHRRVFEVMHRALIRVTSDTTVASAALLLVERNLNCLPVIQYASQDIPVSATQSEQAVTPDVQGDQGRQAEGEDWREGLPLLVGLLTRSDLLTALARSLGAFEPGMQLLIPLHHGSMQPLARALALASEMGIRVHSVMAAPLQSKVPRVATLRLGTINPAPFLMRLQEEQIVYSFADHDV